MQEISAADLNGDYATIRYGPPEGDFVIDILSRLGSALSYVDLEFMEMDIAGTRIRVATPATLYRMKCDTVRPIDKIDAANLRERFHLEKK